MKSTLMKLCPYAPCELLKGVASLAFENKCFNHKRSFGRACTVQNPHGFAQAPNKPLSHFPTIYGGISMVTATEGQVYETLGFNLGGWIGKAQTERHHKENLIVIWVNGQTQGKLTAEMTRQTKRNHWIPKYESNKCHRQGRSNCQHLLIVLSIEKDKSYNKRRF